MVKEARAMSGIRIQNDTHEVALVAVITTLDGICAPNGRGIVISASRALSLFRKPGPELGGRHRKGAQLLRLVGFRSAIHRRERFWTPGAGLIRG
jgi:hypothetical protein